MNKAVQAEKSIDTSCKRAGVTEEGKRWLDFALDPFKDLVRAPAGYPDKDLNPSVSEIVKQTVTITKPASVASGNWDCNIFLDQVAFSRTVYQTAIGTTPNTYLRSGQAATGYNRGGLVVRSGPPGTSLGVATTQNASCLGVDPALYSNESCRVIAIGIEIHDTSNALYKQGSLVTYRVDRPVAQSTTFTLMEDNGATACVPSSSSGPVLVEPPLTMASALDLIGSRQWETKEGAYVVPVMCDDQNPALAALRGIPSYPRMMEGSTWYVPRMATTGVAKAITFENALTEWNVSWPWSMSGIFVAGMHESGELTINFNYIIERFPNTSSTIRRLCYPSPSYDEAALSIYGRVAPTLPTGVPVAENGFADWIKGISSSIANVASRIPHPISQAIGGAALAVHNLTTEYEKPTPVSSMALPTLQMPKDESVTIKVTPKPNPQVTKVVKKPSTRAIVPVTRSKNLVAKKKRKAAEKRRIARYSMLTPASP